jgi:quercetin dioxygenase-like cupin family protein
MTLRTTAAAAAIFVACGAAAQQPPPGAAVTMLGRSAQTATGQPLGAIAAPYEVVFSRAVLPPDGVLPMHKHPWPRYALVESGRIRVRYEAAGITREFGPGEAIIEAIDAWHEGVAVGSEPVRILVIDHVPPGRSNVVSR